MADSAIRRTDVTSITSLDDIPDQVDATWWRKHEHLFEWTKDGKGIRMGRSA